MTDQEIKEAMDRASKPASEGGLRLCSPVHRCFPPRPTVCLICHSTSTDHCALRSVA